MRRLGRSFLFVAVLAFFAYFAVNSSAQNLITLSNSVQTGTSEQKRDALFQIKNLRSEESSRTALPALNDADEMVRATAASAVTFLPKNEAVAAIIPLLNDKKEFVRREAAYALGMVGIPDVAAPLLKLLEKEKIYEVRTAAVAALGSTGDPDAVTFLLSILKKKPNEDQDFLRRSAAHSIGQIAQVVRTGNAYTVTPQNFLPDKYKTAAGDDLTSRYPMFAPAVTQLSQVLQNNNESDDTRREAAFALGAIGSPSATSILRTIQNTTDAYLAEIVKEALLKIDAN